MPPLAGRAEPRSSASRSTHPDAALHEAEGSSLPVTLLLMLVAFGAPTAAGLPVLTGRVLGTDLSSPYCSPDRLGVLGWLRTAAVLAWLRL